MDSCLTFRIDVSKKSRLFTEKPPLYKDIKSIQVA